MPDSHALGQPEPVRDEHGRTVFRAACACMPPGSFWFADRLPDIYQRHQDHLDQLKAGSRAAHPSTRRRTP